MHSHTHSLCIRLVQTWLLPSFVSHVSCSARIGPTQELRDISSMAMEHFDEKIVPIIRHRNQLQPLQPFPSCTSHSSTASSPPRSFAEAQHIYRDRKLHHGQPAFHAPHPTLTPSPSICGSLSPPLPPLLDVYGNVSEPGSSASGSDSPTVVTTSMPQISHLPPCPSLTQVTHGYDWHI